MTDEIWDGKRVIARMVDAYKILYDTTGRVGPSSFGQMLNETNTIGRMRARVQRTSKEVTLMDHVFTGFRYADRQYGPWLREFLEHRPGMRKCVAMHVIGQGEAELRNMSFNAKRMCRSAGLAYSTFRGRRNDGARIIAARLNQLGIDL